MSTNIAIRRLSTGVPGLDEVLGGGLPEFSFNLIAGPPGCGKTTLAHQIMFSLATPERPAIYFTVLGEPPLKMLRYQQQFAFSDQATTFLLGEYSNEGDNNPVFTVADGLPWLRQNVQRNSMVRKLEITKMRGQPTLPGLHTFRISAAGLEVFAPAGHSVAANAERMGQHCRRGAC